MAHDTATGTAPQGVKDERQAAEWVRRMFADIAPRYDLLNHLLSFNIDRGWRRALLQSLEPVCRRPEATILDLCCGTGDVLLDLQGISKATILGADFCHPMLVSAQRKAFQAGRPALLCEADALSLPLESSSVDGVSIAFGFRNLSNYAAALDELRRVLKPGGTLSILEFSHPRGLIMRGAYSIYLHAVLPLVGGAISGSRDAYAYLPDSIARFPRGEELQRMMDAAGFVETTFVLLSGGIAAIHTGSTGD